MKNEQQYHDTINILKEAYFNDTLQHLTCAACAVGNIIAAKTGKKIVLNTSYTLTKWEGYNRDYSLNWLYLVEYENRISPNLPKDLDAAKEQIKATGYTSYELHLVEDAFETADKGNSQDDWMFNGLMAVVDVLGEIHEVEAEQTELSKQLFI